MSHQPRDIWKWRQWQTACRSSAWTTSGRSWPQSFTGRPGLCRSAGHSKLQTTCKWEMLGIKPRNAAVKHLLCLIKYLFCDRVLTGGSSATFQAAAYKSFQGGCGGHTGTHEAAARWEQQDLHPRKVISPTPVWRAFDRGRGEGSAEAFRTVKVSPLKLQYQILS